MSRGAGHFFGGRIRPTLAGRVAATLEVAQRRAVAGTCLAAGSLPRRLDGPGSFSTDLLGSAAGKLAKILIKCMLTFEKQIIK